MKKTFLLFCLISVQSFAQTVYEPGEVDRIAEPRGGADVFSLFISSNVRAPITSAYKGLNGRVFIKAVVETDGSISGPQILRGIDSLCNGEALRVAALFKSWKPAELKNIPVRQAIVIPVVFKSAAITSYNPTERSLVEYYDKSWALTTNPEKFRYKRAIPVDDFGYLHNDIVYQEKDGNLWKELAVVPLRKEKIWEKTYESDKPDSVEAYHFSASHERLPAPLFQVFSRQLNGNMFAYHEYSNEGKPLVDKKYYLNGTLRESRVQLGEIKQEIRWHENGQLASVMESPAVFKKPYIRTIREFRDRDGNQLVRNGNGYCQLTGETYKDQVIFDSGAVKDGFKHGKWTGKLKDSTLVFEENYEKGVLQKGISYMYDNQTEYEEVEVQPEFSGGLASMYGYIGRSTKYPTDAAKAGITGRVFTSFVVCEDGTLCDYKIIKGLYKSIDEEALRVVESMSGKWKPGWQRGRKVRVKYNLPINFTLN